MARKRKQIQSAKPVAGRSRSARPDSERLSSDQSGFGRSGLSQSSSTSVLETDSPETGWSVKTRVILSVLASLHLFCVFSAPWAIPTPSSQLARYVNELTSPLTNLFYMKHGYRFFAPNPGPSHLIVFEVNDESGETVATGRFPDQKNHVPRLMYHRYFMISEHFWGVGSSQSLDRDRELDEWNRATNILQENGFSERAIWIQQNLLQDERKILTEKEIQRVVENLQAAGKPHQARIAERDLRERNTGLELGKKHYDAWLAGIANYLKKKHSGSTVRIWIQEHSIPPFHHVLDGGKLTDDETYGPLILVYAEDEVIQ